VIDFPFIWRYYFLWKRYERYCKFYFRLTEDCWVWKDYPARFMLFIPSYLSLLYSSSKIGKDKSNI